MKATKKILSVLLSVLMVFAMFGVCASAESAGEYLTYTVSTDKETYAPGATVTVTVSISCNFNLTAFRLPIMFDSSVYELPNLINLTALNACKTGGTIGSNVQNDGSFIPDSYDSSAFGCVLVQWTASAAAGKVGCINSAEGEACFSFTLKAKEDAAGLSGTILIPPEYDGFYNMAVKDPSNVTSMSDFYYIDLATATLDYVDATASVVGEEVKLAAAAGSAAIVDEENAYVYGLNVGIQGPADLNKLVTATGNGTVSYTPTDAGFGTGTKITLRSGANTVKEYEAIIFGDVDGDATIALFDATIIISYYAGSADVSGAPFFAGDVNGDGGLDLFDGSKVLSTYAGSADISQTQPY